MSSMLKITSRTKIMTVVFVCKTVPCVEYPREIIIKHKTQKRRHTIRRLAFAILEELC